jgi:small subunit ribosomal protein S20
VQSHGNGSLAVANIKSAIKRIQIAERNRLRNKSYKSALKTLTKKYVAAVERYAVTPSDETKEVVQQSMSAAYSKIDKAVKTGVLHRSNGARKKANIARLFRKKVDPFTPEVSEESTLSPSSSPSEGLEAPTESSGSED